MIAVPTLALFAVWGTKGTPQTNPHKTLDALVMNAPTLALSGACVAAVLGVVFWNACYMKGRKGRSLGYRVMYRRLVKVDTGMPVGTRRAFFRAILHIFDILPLGLGFFVPLISKKHQTLPT